MSRIYTVSFNKQSDTAIVDLFEITPADDKPCEVIGLFMGQTSDFGDAQAEIIPWKVSTGFTTSGSGGGTATPRPLDGIDAAAGFVCETMNTTVAETGTEIILHQDSMNVAVGEKLWLPEGCEWHCSQAQTRLTVRWLTAPTDSITVTGTLYVKEHS